MSLPPKILPASTIQKKKKIYINRKYLHLNPNSIFKSKFV